MHWRSKGRSGSAVLQCYAISPTCDLYLYVHVLCALLLLLLLLLRACCAERERRRQRAQPQRTEEALLFCTLCFRAFSVVYVCSTHVRKRSP